MPTESLMSSAIRGGVAGGVATVGMTAAMMLMHRCLPRRQRYGLPPEQIVGEMLERADAENELTHREFETLAMLAHHGYGISMGAVYGVLEPHRRQTPPVVSGLGYGLAVWAMSYIGWLPAMGLDASATKEPVQRNTLTLISHLIWGATTGFLTATTHHAPAQR